MSCDCDGSGWKVLERPRGTAVEACACRLERIRVQQEAEAQEAAAGTPLTKKAAVAILESMFANMQFAPHGPGHGLVANALVEMCATVEQAQWVATRACSLYQKWGDCGLPGLRQILCSRHKPKDNVYLLYTEAYPEGIPGASQPLTEFPKLPRGAPVSENRQLDQAVSRLAESKAMVKSGEPK